MDCSTLAAPLALGTAQLAHLHPLLEKSHPLGLQWTHSSAQFGGADQQLYTTAASLRQTSDHCTGQCLHMSRPREGQWAGGELADWASMHLRMMGMMTRSEVVCYLQDL